MIPRFRQNKWKIFYVTTFYMYTQRYGNWSEFIFISITLIVEVYLF